MLFEYKHRRLVKGIQRKLKLFLDSLTEEDDEKFRDVLDYAKTSTFPIEGYPVKIQLNKQRSRKKLYLTIAYKEFSIFLYATEVPSLDTITPYKDKQSLVKDIPTIVSYLDRHMAFPDKTLEDYLEQIKKFAKGWVTVINACGGLPVSNGDPTFMDFVRQKLTDAKIPFSYNAHTIFFDSLKGSLPSATFDAYAPYRYEEGSLKYNPDTPIPTTDFYIDEPFKGVLSLYINLKKFQDDLAYIITEGHQKVYPQ
jgi:hypothetical protein